MFYAFFSAHHFLFLYFSFLSLSFMHSCYPFYLCLSSLFSHN
jgi:hypothetical protein